MEENLLTVLPRIAVVEPGLRESIWWQLKEKKKQVGLMAFIFHLFNQQLQNKFLSSRKEIIIIKHVHEEFYYGNLDKYIYFCSQNNQTC